MRALEVRDVEKIKSPHSSLIPANQVVWMIVDSRPGGVWDAVQNSGCLQILLVRCGQ